MKISHLSKRGFGTSFYLWQPMPRLGPKASELKQQFTIPRGSPKKIDAFDNLNVKKIFVGLRHSAVLSGKLDFIKRNFEISSELITEFLSIIINYSNY